MNANKAVEIVNKLHQAGLIKSHRDLTTASIILEQHEASSDPIWRMDTSDTWVAIKESQNRSIAGVGILTTPIMRAIAPLIGRVYVFDYIDKAGKFQGGRLCFPNAVPDGFDPKKGILKAA